MSEREFPITPRPAEDSRFTFGLTADVSQVLASHGYALVISGMDFVELQLALFRFLYGTEEKDTGTTGGESTPEFAEQIVYRAGYEGELIPLGHCLTLQAAQARCEEQVSREYPPERTIAYEWLHEDSDDGDDLEPYELAATVDGGPEEPTGYTVTPILVTDAPDADAES